MEIVTNIVWQSVPYLFADFVYVNRNAKSDNTDVTDLSSTVPYRIYLYLIAVIPLPLLWLTVERAQLTYAVLGSLFMPLLALTLLLMNNRAEWVGQQLRSKWITNLVLAATLFFFGYMAVRTAVLNLSQLLG
jgi:hypothetical protein